IPPRAHRRRPRSEPENAGVHLPDVEPYVVEPGGLPRVDQRRPRRGAPVRREGRMDAARTGHRGLDQHARLAGAGAPLLPPAIARIAGATVGLRRAGFGFRVTGSLSLGSSVAPPRAAGLSRPTNV